MLSRTLISRKLCSEGLSAEIAKLKVLLLTPCWPPAPTLKRKATQGIRFSQKQWLFNVVRLHASARNVWERVVGFNYLLCGSFTQTPVIYPLSYMKTKSMLGYIILCMLSLFAVLWKTNMYKCVTCCLVGVIESAHACLNTPRNALKRLPEFSAICNGHAFNSLQNSTRTTYR